jgi:hypothetical protein
MYYLYYCLVFYSGLFTTHFQAHGDSTVIKFTSRVIHVFFDIMEPKGPQLSLLHNSQVVCAALTASYMMSIWGLGLKRSEL